MEMKKQKREGEKEIALKLAKYFIRKEKLKIEEVTMREIEIIATAIKISCSELNQFIGLILQEQDNS
jgi:hypothetical protein